ncbi:MAG: nonstructural protein [Microvirus sp.]|nr:MAG: nonstructural protein [Microvirus sp.]
MLIKYFSIYDKQTMSYGQLFPAQTMGAAERSFKELVNNPDSQQSKYPDDFALYLILDFDDESAIVITNFQPPMKVVEAIQLKTI